MNRFMIILVVAMVPATGLQAGDSVSGNGGTAVQVERAEKAGTFEDLLREMWGRLRSVAPKLAADSGSRKTQIAGVRGAESTGTLLKPYWKGDRTNDKEYAQELTSYNKAQSLADSGDFAGAVAAFSEFLKKHPHSSLRANAQFGLGLAYGGTNARQKGVATLNEFIKTYPRHPLGADARKMVAVLKQR